MLSEREHTLLLEGQAHLHAYAAGTLVGGAESAREWPLLILSGWACRERIRPNGRRQLLSILLPGDLIGNSEGRRALDMVEIAAITDVKLVSLANVVDTVRENPEDYPGIVEGLVALRCAEERYLLDQLVRLGTQSAVQRIAGFMLEMFQRCREIGFVTGNSFVMPLTQEMLGDAVGVSVVHVNRVVGELKERHLIEWHSGILVVRDLAGLALAAGSETVRSAAG